MDQLPANHVMADPTLPVAGEDGPGPRHYRRFPLEYPGWTGSAGTRGGEVGKLAGLARKAACRYQAVSTTARATAASTASSSGEWLRRVSTARTGPAIRTTASEIPRWKRPASEWGQGSIACTTSLPSSESVQSGLAGQWLQIWGRPRERNRGRPWATPL